MEYVFPLKQHVGVPCEPVVMTGEEVKRGQLIAEKPENALGSPIYSSICGKVTAVGETQITIEEAGTDFGKYEPLKGNDSPGTDCRIRSGWTWRRRFSNLC